MVDPPDSDPYDPASGRVTAPESRDGVAADVRAAIADAEVGAGELFAGLVSVDGIGEVSVDAGTATVEVTLPVPSAAIRGRIERGVREAAAGVEGIDAVEVIHRARAADPGERVDLLPDVKTVVAVASGKGGVGKSTVAANLAGALADAGASVGLLDADVYGPNAPAVFGIDGRAPAADANDRIRPREAHGVRVMSMEFVAGEDDPVIWRGPMVDDVVAQLFGDVRWGELDYLVVDLPPGTGDAQLSLVQRVPVTGVVIVTTPDPVAVDDARRGLQQFVRYGVPVLGVAENMRSFECPDCGERHALFGADGGGSLAEEFDLPVLGGVPLDPAVGARQADPDDPPGVSLPLLGRVELPRTREERSGGAPPVVLRPDDGDGPAARTALRALATRAAARVNERVVRME